METKTKKFKVKNLFQVPKRITITKLETKVVTDISVYRDRQQIRVSAEILNRCRYKI